MGVCVCARVRVRACVVCSGMGEGNSELNTCAQGEGLTLPQSWSQLVITPRALLCAALPLLLSAHCPAACYPLELPVLPCLNI